jgi:DNA replication and repair protein RecF
VAYLQSLEIKNFRCFQDIKLSFDNPIVFIQGDNGTGKTALLETIYYLCYLKSFRSHIPRELIRFDSESFFLRGRFVNDAEENILQVGLILQKKVVKVNEKPVKNFQELFHCARVISLTESDLFIIQGSPDKRRSFIDNLIFLHEPEFAKEMRLYKNILSQRTALLQTKVINDDLYYLWTRKLWDASIKIKNLRISYLKILSLLLEQIIDQYPIDQPLALEYCCKYEYSDSFENFSKSYLIMKNREIRLQRTLFGVHLDDIGVYWNKADARLFASRGQQKLIILLLKIAQAQGLNKENGLCIMLLDDFITDFDLKRIRQTLAILNNLRCNLFFSCAQKSSILEQELNKYNVQKVVLEPTNR